MDFTGRTLAGKYLLDKLLGRGGMGAVWRGVHTVTRRKIAVKILDEKFLTNENVVRRFEREARTAGGIDHEGIVKILDIDETEEGIPFIVMEFLEGESLAHRIDYGQRMTEDALVAIGVQLLDALHAAHESGVVHRDLKPDNIYLVPDVRGERVKILDFGISSKAGEENTKLTITGSVLGTPHYMSPEQAMGDTDTDRRVDIYAAGVVLYECAVGAVPFDGANYNKLLRVILDNDPVPPSERGAHLSRAVEAVILRALSKRREDRAKTALEMRQELLLAHRGDESSAPRRLEAPEPVSSPLDSSLPDPSVPFEALPAISRVARTEDSVAVRWLDAGLEQAPASRPSIEADASTRISSGSRARPSLERPSLERPSLERPIEPALEVALEVEPELSLRDTRPRSSSSSGKHAAITSAAIAAPKAIASPQASERWSAASERAEAPPSQASPNRWVLTLVVGLALVTLLAFGLRSVLNPPEASSSSSSSATVEPSAGSPAGQEASSKTTNASRRFVEIEVVVRPLDAEARIRLDGIPGATSPLRVRTGTPHTIEVSARGYITQRIELETDRSRRVVVDLEPLR